MSRLTWCCECSSLFLCVCISAPTHACTSLSCSLFLLLHYIALHNTSSSSSSSPPPLFVTCVHSSLGASLLGFALLLFPSLPTLSSFTNKGQVGIRVGTHLNKAQPSKLQIYFLPAVCNCTYPEVCPSLLFCVQFTESAYLELNLRRFLKHHC